MTTLHITLSKPQMLWKICKKPIQLNLMFKFMKNIAALLLFVALVFNCSTLLFAQNAQQYALLGNFRLQSGQVIENCQIGYRAYGTLNADKSNAILVPTWFSGTSAQLKSAYQSLIDSTKFYIILVDALGNGVSSSPSNSKKQRDKKFPHITITDMVNAEYKMLTEVLKINHLHTVMGTSMGGMQTFQWVVSYPTFMDRAVSIAGTPKQGFHDLLGWTAELTPIEAAKNKKEEQEAMKTVGLIHAINLFSPAYRNAQKDDFKAFAEKETTNYAKINAQDWAAQLRAMLGHDIYTTTPKEQMKDRIKAKMLIIYANQDMMVTPQTSMEFADLLQCERMELKSNCGHLAPSCEGAEMAKMIRAFLVK
jgi:homoserine O-acetyltransferase/O-succinyltransferase